MKQHYFVVVLAHSLHGRLRRIHIPHQALYVVVGLALFGSVSLFGMVSSYLRMTWKVANYNSLRDQVGTLQTKYQALLKENGQKEEQLASLQMMAFSKPAARKAGSQSSTPFFKYGRHLSGISLLR